MSFFWRAKTHAPIPMALPEHPRWRPMPPGHSFVHRIEFDPGAPAFAYDNQGLMEFPVLAGFNNRYQFESLQPPSNIYPRQLWQQGLGQSWEGQPPPPSAEAVFPPGQLNAIIVAAQSGGVGYF
jgi:hypothetical protein